MEGRVSAIPHAHPIADGRGGDAVYLDTLGRGQLVAYVRGQKPKEGSWVRLAGTALEFEAEPARPGGGRKFRVRHLDAAEVVRLPARDTVEALVEELGREEVPLERKRVVQGEIYRAGIDAFPVLIAHLGDARIYERGRDVQNYLGLPAHKPPPPPILADVRVGDVCRDLLHRLLTPSYRSPHERVFKPRGELFQVRDWPSWWERNQGKTLEEIHRGLEPLVDRYFESGGDTQLVE